MRKPYLMFNYDNPPMEPGTEFYLISCKEKRPGTDIKYIYLRDIPINWRGEETTQGFLDSSGGWLYSVKCKMRVVEKSVGYPDAFLAIDCDEVAV